MSTAERAQMPGGHDRRSFLREMLRGASRAAGEIGTLRDSVAEPVEQPLWPGPFAEISDATPSPLPAAPAERLATTDELRDLCAEIGHEEWADDAVDLSRRSIRLTPGLGGRSWLGGAPEVSTPFTWPVWQGEELAFLGEMRLEDLPDTDLPREGALLFFFALERAPSGLRPAEAGACRVFHVGDGPTERIERDEHLPEVTVTVSTELMLPFEPVPATVDGWQFNRWMELRERLAAIQGVELEESAADYHALHRLLGYPDAFAETMERDAHLVSQGIDLETQPYLLVEDDEEAADVSDWCLLLQLSSDDVLGVAFGPFERLYVWIRDNDLRAGRFDEIRAFVR